jgi:carbonic anhydrase/acetyltransferase-like protein (isoleucine patch superfamily)
LYLSKLGFKIGIGTMSILKSRFKIGKSVAVGMGAVVLTPVVVPALAGALKPIAKAAIKGGMTAYGMIKASAAGALDVLRDIAAEAEAELTDASE